MKSLVTSSDKTLVDIGRIICPPGIWPSFDSAFYLLNPNFEGGPSDEPCKQVSSLLGRFGRAHRVSLTDCRNGMKNRQRMCEERKEGVYSGLRSESIFAKNNLIFWKQVSTVEGGALCLICCKRFYHGQIGRPRRTKGVGDGIQIFPSNLRLVCSSSVIFFWGFESYIRIWIFRCSCCDDWVQLRLLDYSMWIKRIPVSRRTPSSRTCTPLLHEPSSIFQNVYLGLDCWAVETRWFTAFIYSKNN